MSVRPEEGIIPAVGTSKRYAHVVDAQMNERILERAAQTGKLQTLSAAELELDRLAVTIDPIPKPVKAWVRFGETPVLVDAEACRWTSRAVGLRFHVRGREHRCWVWMGAIVDDS